MDLRIKPGTDISINTPILNINIGADFLRRVDSRKDIYEIDIDLIRKVLNTKFIHLFENSKHIDDYVSVGQIDRRSRGHADSDSDSDTNSDTDSIEYTEDPNISIILANTRIVPQTNRYKEIKKNIWLAESVMSGTKMRSVGTIYSCKKDGPDSFTPIFPVAYLKRVSGDEPNYAIYSDQAHGRYTLNDTALNIDKKNMRMINSTGDISLIPSNTFVPMTPGELYGGEISGLEISGLDKSYNRKVYFTAHGTIANDSNCVKPKDNMSKMSNMECNGISTVMANESNDLSDNERVKINDINRVGNKEKKSNGSQNNNTNDTVDMGDMNSTVLLSDREKKIIMREKDEPWFTDPQIVGDIADYDDPHTITGHHNTFDMTESELYDIVDDIKPQGSIVTMTGDSDTLVLIGTFDGNADEIMMPFSSDCLIDPVIGYSRYDTLQKCMNRENRNGVERKIEAFESDKPHSDTEVNYNNYIMFLMFVIIIALLIYKLR
jgi:hypothetical protein